MLRYALRPGRRRSTWSRWRVRRRASRPPPLRRARRLSFWPSSTICQLLQMPARHRLLATADVDPKRLHQILLRTYEQPPADFESLLGVPGLGPKSLRALALVAELIHGARASTRDPARFAFAHGGKDGTPFPVDRQTYDQTIELLRGALGRAKIDHSDRSRALKRLAAFAAGSHSGA